MRRSKKNQNLAKAVGQKVTPLTNRGNTTVLKKFPPVIRTSADTCIIKNKELCFGASTASASDGINKVGLNPADPNVFGWLSSIAGRYTYYRWKKLKVMYQTGCDTNINGSVNMAVFYDIEDLNQWWAGTFPLNGISQVEGYTAGPYWGSTITCHKDLTHSAEIEVNVDVQKAHMRTQWCLVDRTSSPPTGAEGLNNQSVPVFLGWVMTANGSGSTRWVGAVHVEYEIELRHPTAQAANAAFRAEYGYDPMKDMRWVTPQFPPIPPPPADPKPPTLAAISEDDQCEGDLKPILRRGGGLLIDT